MATELKMPQMGYDMEEGTVVRWLKEEGSTVGRNEPVAEIETDKAVVEFESEAEGVLLRIVASEGSIVPVGETIALVGLEGEEADNVPSAGSTESTDSDTAIREELTSESERHEVQEPIRNTTQESSESTPTTRILATPVARRIADELGIDLKQVAGSGPGGRITKKDVETFDPASSTSTKETNFEMSSSETPEQSPEEIPETVSETTDPSVNSMPGEKEPLSRMRQQIARVTVKSKTEKPHFYVSAEIDMTKAMVLRKQVNDQLSDDGVRITVNDLIVKACIESLKKYPKFNAYFQDDGIQFNNTINIAVAIAGEEGLIVPAILDCGSKTLRELSQMVKDLANRSASGTLNNQEYTGGTFAISNLGMFDVTGFLAIIHPPQSAVLAVGTVAEKPVVRDGELAVANIMNATISADHRIVDGVEGAEFIVEVKRLLENPMGLIV
ncbi:MAG: 2-oxo acid dehydrogenase subunit E2 [SAR202 cluster bacterium]|jgi:pyruvate dehydrogenase E2 component (dihydrolipoamide acetyltransferase)|nr:MAG: 2-oxo acid dehydrogenase subunit E2 [SAR202 cluster bacterium]MQG74628.1 2-oxo acid dehydrogenase subunit E2 [SAR202 cluster bacterium]